MSQYSVKDGTLFATREMVVKQAKISPVTQWDAYAKFFKGLKTDQTSFFVLTEDGSEGTTSTQGDSEAQRLLKEALTEMQARHFEKAKDLTAQVERINPKEHNLWAMRGFIAMMTLEKEQAISDFKKEIEYYPKDMRGYLPLAELLQSLGRTEQAIQTLSDALVVKADDADAAGMLGGILFAAKRYAEVPTALERAIGAAPDRIALRRMRVEALLRSGQKDKGYSEAQELVKINSDPLTLNDLAYDLTEAGGPNDAAHDWAERAVAKTEEQIAQAKLSSAVDKNDLANVMMLAAEWDTLGWICFKENHLPEAEKYVEAAWRMNPSADVADHLGEIYEKEGKHAAAVHMWRLALALKVGDKSAQKHLRKAGIQ